MKLMKRMLWIFAIASGIITVSITALYTIRKNKALDQYVHPDSQSIISVSLDDLLLDNIDQLFNRQTIDSAAPQTDLLDIESWWGAGIGIPAQIHFFSLNDSPLTFFTIQKIKNIEKWKAFLKENGTDAVQLRASSAQPLSSARLPSGISVLYDDQYLLLRVTILKQDDDNEMHAVWKKKNNWVHVRDIPFPTAEHPKAHVVYRHVNGTFQLLADMTKEQVSLSGHWQLDSDLATVVQMRVPKVNDYSFLAFWSNLSLTETPFVTKFLSVFSGIELSTVIENSYGYVDLFVYADTTTQRDTAIVYDYDKDFNAIEKNEIQEVTVPIIESVWKGNEQLTAALPEKLYYRFYKHTGDSLVSLSTKEDHGFPATFATTTSPFQISINFGHLPPSWANDKLRMLQDREFRVDIETSILNPNTLGISGNIRYRER